MPKRSLCLASLMVLVLALSGCMVTKSAYEQKEQEADTLAKTVADLDRKNKDLTARTEKLQAENDELKKQLAAKDDLLQLKSEEIAKQDARQAAMVDEVERMKAQQARSAAGEAQGGAAGRKAGLKSIRLKVLSGDGRIDSARRMAKRLTAMGYRVESVGMAESSDYPANTVYFAAKYKPEAKTLAAKIGKDTIVKPLTWKSVFAIIVVTGG
ncbi:MAG TPA: LytR C-terminal domain-containing protein [Syntrophales bacterium]|nr:LytR C-terminal domain-containing protein [Syntrophobacterales bacterium]HQL91424.1 LytR C-terminal domain-containing protein [Syntrophales bacterium]